MLFRDKPKGPITAASLAAQLQQVEQDLATLESQEPALSLAVAEQVGGAEANLTALQERIGEMRANIATLRAAHRAAVDREARAAAGALAAKDAEQRRHVAALLDQRDAAARTFQAALAKACAEYRKMIDLGVEAHDAAALVGNLPAGSLTEPAEVRRVVAEEMFRASGDGSMTRAYTLPGGASHDLRRFHDPAAFVPLADVMKAASAHAVHALEAKAGTFRHADPTPIEVARQAHELAT